LKSAVTICLVPQARAGPFVFHGDLAANVRRAARIGFDAVEVFAPSGDSLDVGELRRLLSDHGVALAAVGTGPGFVLHGFTLIDPDAVGRARAMEYAKRVIDLGGALGAPAIVGSMQGRHADGEREAALGRLAESLGALGAHAKRYGVPLLLEPLNRYETNVLNRQAEAAEFVRSRGIGNVKILADLFHMNIEEVDIAATLRELGGMLGHVHFVDSNRRAAGMGHLDFGPIIAALREMNYLGYLSAEAMAGSDSEGAARKTLETFRRLVHDDAENDAAAS
jgi:sugar phosphate isomerase/epimerase